MRSVWVSLVVSLSLALPVLAAESTPEADLVAGVRQVEEGDFDAAVVTLDRVVQRLAGQGGKAKERARAYTYLAIAYLGLSQEQAAKAKFVEALKQDKALELSAQDYPPRVVQAFENAKKEMMAEATPTAAPVVTTAEAKPATPAVSPQGGGGSGKKWLFLGAGAAALAGGAGVALGGGDVCRDGGPLEVVVGSGPTPDINWSPSCPVRIVVVVQLTGSTSDTVWSVDTLQDGIRPPVRFGSAPAGAMTSVSAARLPTPGQTYRVLISSTTGNQGHRDFSY